MNRYPKEKQDRRKAHDCKSKEKNVKKITPKKFIKAPIKKSKTKIHTDTDFNDKIVLLQVKKVLIEVKKKGRHVEVIVYCAMTIIVTQIKKGTSAKLAPVGHIDPVQCRKREIALFLPKMS